MGEVLARIRHEDYVAAELAKGATADENPSLVPWEQLSDSLKNSNRRFADSIVDKLSAIDCVAVRAKKSAGGGSESPFSFTDAEIEQLARMEHQRWVDDLLRDHWRPTSGNKDPERKLHPLLMSWSELSEAEREKDRDVIRDLPRMLERAGYEIRRVQG